MGLDDSRCAHPAVAGAKAAWLARGRTAGLPVLAGVVVPAAESTGHMGIGADALARRGSGGARLEVSGAPLSDPLAEAVVAASESLGDPLVVRSSSVLESGAAWAGAFTSYLDVHPEDVPRAVVGCWASAFGVSALARHAADGVAPGSAPMAVLVQPSLHPDFGGTARIEADQVVITAVSGSPTPLVQGWEPGARARLLPGGDVSGPGAVELMGIDRLRAVASVLRTAQEAVGATACEWAVDDTGVHLLQLTRPQPRTRTPVVVDPALTGDTALRIARLANRFPGPLGEAFVLPWAMGHRGGLDAPPPSDTDPAEALELVAELATALTADVWSLPEPEAQSAAEGALSRLRGTDPATALRRIEGLRRPDPDRADLVLSLLGTVRRHLVAVGAVARPEAGWLLDPTEIREAFAHPSAIQRRERFGFDRWEPFVASVVVGSGSRSGGIPAAPGIAAGRMCSTVDTNGSGFRPRDVIVASLPTPDLAPLLWDAAAVVTTGGGAGAHLFESARALAIPAVCGVDLEVLVGEGLPGGHILAVDGDDGSVYATER